MNKAVAIGDVDDDIMVVTAGTDGVEVSAEIDGKEMFFVFPPAEARELGNAILNAASEVSEPKE